MEKPIIIDIFTDNGDLSHYELIDVSTGDVLWSSFPEETIAMGRKINDCNQADELSFWFMRDNHTFIKIESNNLNEIIGEYKKISKKYPYGMVCPVTLIRDGDELRRVGANCHVDGKGRVKMADWITSISNDDDIKRILKL